MSNNENNENNENILQNPDEAAFNQFINKNKYFIVDTETTVETLIVKNQLVCIQICGLLEKFWSQPF